MVIQTILGIFIFVCVVAVALVTVEIIKQSFRDHVDKERAKRAERAAHIKGYQTK